MKVLAISGSLRAASINTGLLQLAARLAPAGMQITLCTAVGDLPLFNPDLEAYPPHSVVALHAQVDAADALLIASPEYAHGVTAVIKNTLDWLVGFGPFCHKPVAVLNTSARSHHADDALRETLRTMSAVILEPASIVVPVPCAREWGGTLEGDPAVRQALVAALQALQVAVAQPA